MQAKIGTDLKRSIELLKQGELVAIPTETVYGLAGNAFDQKAVGEIFSVKNRPSFDPLILHLHDKRQLHKVCDDVPKVFHTLYDAFCPGPLTFILPKKETISDLVTAGHNSVGIRFPKHELTRELLKLGDLALAAPSANPFGYVSPTSAKHVNDQLGSKIHYILDGGECEVGLESTIINLCNSEPEILRLGGLSLEKIEDVLGQKLNTKTSSSNPTAPGMLSAHYSPGKKVLFGERSSLLSNIDPEKTGAIVFKQSIPSVPLENQWILSPKGDVNEAAQMLFKALRETDKTELDLILAEKFPENGLGRAINDRLKRASF